MKDIDKTINRTANANCPACKDMRQHKAEEWKLYHPLAGTGFSREHGVPKIKDK